MPDIFKAMADGEANATVELTPNMAGPALDALAAYKKDGTMPPKWIQTQVEALHARRRRRPNTTKRKDSTETFQLAGQQDGTPPARFAGVPART